MSYDLSMSKSKQAVPSTAALVSDRLSAEQGKEIRAALAAQGFDVGSGETFEADLAEYAIQILVFAEEITIHIAYLHHDKEQARRVFEQMLAAVQALESITGYVTYDRQLGRMIDSAADLDAMVSAYIRRMGLMSKTF